MKEQVILKKITDLILPVILDNNADLIDIELKGKRGNQLLRIYVDTETGISLDLCEILSREISDLLDRKDIFKDRYRLEVSSPGIERPLRNSKDFKRHITRRVELQFDQNDKGLSKATGIIKAVNEDSIELEVEGKSVLYYLSDIEFGNVLSPW